MHLTDRENGVDGFLVFGLHACAWDAKSSVVPTESHNFLAIIVLNARRTQGDSIRLL